MQLRRNLFPLIISDPWLVDIQWGNLEGGGQVAYIYIYTYTHIYIYYIWDCNHLLHPFLEDMCPEEHVNTHCSNHKICSKRANLIETSTYTWDSKGLLPGGKDEQMADAVRREAQPRSMLVLILALRQEQDRLQFKGDDCFTDWVFSHFIRWL